MNQLNSDEEEEDSNDLDEITYNFVRNMLVENAQDPLNNFIQTATKSMVMNYEERHEITHGETFPTKSILFDTN